MSNIYYRSIQNLYISQLDSNLQIKIKNHLIIFFTEEVELNEDELNKELELAMNSRVSDLEDTIDIKKILN